jgi:ferrous iron transport protein B
MHVNPLARIAPPFPVLQGPAPATSASLRVALAGNPNCGKSSLFNALTGSHQHVGNYPGVTVEQRSGRLALGDLSAELIDLPGTYSLSSYTPEERVAQNELSRHLDVVVVVADSTNLKRNLVLLAQVMQLGANPVLCLNMADEARAAGQKLDVALMERLLGFPVVETAAKRGEGIDRLREAILRAREHPVRNHRLVLGERLDRAIAAVKKKLPAESGGELSANWIATRLLVGDSEHLARTAGMPGGEEAIDEAGRQRARLEAETGLDVTLYYTERTFGFVDGLLRECMVQAPRADARALSDRIDSIVVHPLLGLPLFALVMYGLFWLTFAAGEAPMRWIDGCLGLLRAAISSLWAPGSQSLLRSLIVDGIIGGVGGVLVFLPNIVLLFLGLAFLEDTGYMARAAFLTDRAMHRFGLHGKSFIPIMTGLGCSVPGILATRTLENERDRLTTMLVLPLVPCGARLPIWMLLVPAFFPAALRAPALWSIYALGIGLALVVALLLRKSILEGEDAPFVMELPPYRLPTLRGAMSKVLERAWLYLRKAGTTILAVSILLWAATTFPRADSYRVDADLAAGRFAVEGTAAPAGVPTLSPSQIEASRASERLEASAAGHIGHALEPLFAPLGFDWKIVTAMLGAFAAKEVFVAQMGIIYAIGAGGAGSAGLRAALAHDYSPLAGVSLIVFLLIATPCVATIAATRRESGHWRWALLQLGGLTAIAYVLSLVVYQLGSLLT